VKTKGENTKLRKKIRMYKPKIPSKDAITDLLKNEDWPTQTDIAKNRKMWSKELIVRPTIKLQSTANNIFKSNEEWSQKEISIKAACWDSFKAYIKNLDTTQQEDSSKFYRIINSLINYKVRGNIAKGVSNDNEVIRGWEMDKVVKEYFEKIFDSETMEIEIQHNNIFSSQIDIDRAWNSIAKNKAVGNDFIAGDVYRQIEYQDDLKSRIKDHFESYLRTKNVPAYFMEGRLILISKTKSEYPSINQIRPITILPAITKLFELSILHFLEKATQLPIFCTSQRGFTKGKSTAHNIHDLMSTCKELQLQRSRDKTLTPRVVFFDFEKAYDSVPRDLMVRKLYSFQIPYNVIGTIKCMLDNFKLRWNNESIATKRGLVQGSVLSPILFNLFVNDLLLIMQSHGISTRAYADDIVCICKSSQEAEKAIDVMKVWSTANRMKVNSSKSGILRILSRKGKAQSTSNSLSIPEVTSYWYLGIKITQSLNMNEHEMKIKGIEQNSGQK
jgi:hypothetical protein